MADLRWKHAIESGLIKMPKRTRTCLPKRKKPDPMDDRYTTRGGVRKSPVGHPGEGYYTTEEAMARLLVSRPTLSRLEREGLVSSVKRQIRKGEKSWTTCSFYEVDGVDQLRAERRREGKL